MRNCIDVRTSFVRELVDNNKVFEYYPELRDVVNPDSVYLAEGIISELRTIWKRELRRSFPKCHLLVLRAKLDEEGEIDKSAPMMKEFYEDVLLDELIYLMDWNHYFVEKKGDLYLYGEKKSKPSIAVIRLVEDEHVEEAKEVVSAADHVFKAFFTSSKTKPIAGIVDSIFSNMHKSRVCKRQMLATTMGQKMHEEMLNKDRARMESHLSKFSVDRETADTYLAEHNLHKFEDRLYLDMESFMADLATLGNHYNVLIVADLALRSGRVKGHRILTDISLDETMSLFTDLDAFTFYLEGDELVAKGYHADGVDNYHFRILPTEDHLDALMNHLGGYAAEVTKDALESFTESFKGIFDELFKH